MLFHCKEEMWSMKIQHYYICACCAREVTHTYTTFNLIKHPPWVPSPESSSIFSSPWGCRKICGCSQDPDLAMCYVSSSPKPQIQAVSAFPPRQRPLLPYMSTALAVIFFFLKFNILDQSAPFPSLWQRRGKDEARECVLVSFLSASTLGLCLPLAVIKGPH